MKDGIKRFSHTTISDKSKLKPSYNKFYLYNLYTFASVTETCEH